MKIKYLLNFLLVFCFLTAAAFAQRQTTVVINDPTKEDKPLPATKAEENLIKRSVLPKVRKMWADEAGCEEAFEIAGTAKGTFSKTGAEQTLIFYQFCQTGNGFGNNGLVLMENGKITASYVSESGWALGIKSLPDINQNGLNEFLVYYSGGMHQGAGGTGADVMEFSGTGGEIKALGWFQASSFGEEADELGYKVSVKPGKTPIFYREKYISPGENEWRKSGRIAAFKLDKVDRKFDALK
jgi:hypothetical protein